MRFVLKTVAAAFLMACPLSALAQTSDLTAWVDSVIETDSQGWNVYSYNSGSASDVYIAKQYSDGGVDVHASYSYGSTDSYVDIYVKDGVITCIQYEGESCRAVNTHGSNIGGYAALFVAAVIATVITENAGNPCKDNAVLTHC